MIKILCVGKIKEAYLSNLIEDYKKRISKYHKIEIVEIKDNENHEKELDDLKKRINYSDFNIALDLKGADIDSVDFSNLIENTFSINSNITFIIGGSLGLDDEIRKRVNKVIRFSLLTFPHGLFRGILLEQIYRSFKIMNNEKYHK